MKAATAENRISHAGNRGESLFAWFFWILLLFLTGTAALFSSTALGKAAFFFCLLLPFISFFFTLFLKNHLSASFSLPVNASKDQPVSGSVTLFNSGIFACRKAIVRFRVRNALTDESFDRTIRLSAPSRGSASVPFTICCAHCGMLQFSVKEAFLYDWFGLFRTRAELNARDGILILPMTFPAQIEVSLPYSEQGDEENQNPLKGMEDPSEVYAFREYMPGDPVRQIHWKLTAKRGLPILKEISRPVSRTLLLFWKKTPGIPAEAADALAEAFSSAAMSLASRQIPFTLGWQDTDGIHMEPIADETALFGAISLAVRRGAQKDGMPDRPDTTDYAKVLWFSGAYPFEEESVLPAESSIFLCNSKMPESGNLYTVFFHPEEAARVFRAIQV